MNTFFQHRDVHKYTWYRLSTEQKSLIDFCIESAKLFLDVLDVQVNREAELSTDHHLSASSTSCQYCPLFIAAHSLYIL